MKEERKKSVGVVREGKWNTGCKKKGKKRTLLRNGEMKENEAEGEIMMLGKEWEIKRDEEWKQPRGKK